MSHEATLVGTGTSTGVPVIGCGCEVCTSTNPRNRRLRTGAKIVTAEGRVVLLDTPTDLRQQALRFGLPRVDAVVYTHAHADHTLGLDELRIFNFRQQMAIPCYGSAATLEVIRRHFAYIFEPDGGGHMRPQLELREIDGPFRVAGLDLLPVPILHGGLPIEAYRIGSFAYVTDVSDIPEPSFELLDGLEVLVLGALRYRSHATHYSIPEAIEAATRIGAGRTIFTHLSHEVDYGVPQIDLPAGMEFGYDGLSFDIE